MGMSENRVKCCFKNVISLLIYKYDTTLLSTRVWRISIWLGWNSLIITEDLPLFVYKRYIWHAQLIRTLQEKYNYGKYCMANIKKLLVNEVHQIRLNIN